MCADRGALPAAVLYGPGTAVLVLTHDWLFWRR